jgi:primosomal protein N' (replication factor Y) (superfamily II helicase)
MTQRDKAVLRDWLGQGWIEPVSVAAASAVEDHIPSLTEEQTAVLAALRAAGNEFNAVVLHGVTGSGKTEVYLQRVADVLASGRQVLVLVPEIHLTPQLTERFSRAFRTATLVSLHSNLADGERRAMPGWRQCKAAPISCSARVWRCSRRCPVWA